MGDDRNRILDLLAAGKITAEEAGRLLDALEASPGQPAAEEASAKAGAKSGTAQVLRHRGQGRGQARHVRRCEVHIREGGERQR